MVVITLVLDGYDPLTVAVILLIVNSFTSLLVHTILLHQLRA